MPLGTLDRSPPPFFRQGPSALTKLLLFAALALFLMVADARFKLAGPARTALTLVLQPVQRLLLTPVDAWEMLGDYSRGMERAMVAEDKARRQLVLQAERLARADLLQAENQRLRALLALQPELEVHSQAAEVLYEAADPYSRRVVIDRGSRQGVVAGSPVINEAGVLGQVTGVYLFSAEVTLLTDKDAAIPVLNTRSQQRGAAFGGSEGAGMELRFMPANADVKQGDLLSTSGLDGVYPAGLPVARVASVERRGNSSFARIGLAPVAGLDDVRHVLVLRPLSEQLGQRAEPPQPAASAASAASSAPKTLAKPAAKSASKAGKSKEGA